MKKNFAFLSFAFLSTVLGLHTSISIASSDPFEDAPADLVQLVNNTYICVFKDHILPDNVPAFVNEIVTQTGVTTRHTYNTALKGFSGHMSAVAVRKLKENNPNIKYCEQNALIKLGGQPVTAGRGQGKGSPNQATARVSPQITPRGVTRVGGPVDGRGLSVWVIDSGIDLDNPDLNVDASRGKDVVKIIGNSTVDDVYGHGTHVAGTIAAKDDGFDVVGVAAGATVIPVRILKSSDYGTVDDAIAGIDYVAANARPGEVANMSSWWWKHHVAFHQAAYNLADSGNTEGTGVPFIVISGNGGWNLNEWPAEPAHVDHPNLYTVSAVSRLDIFTDFSNYGYAGDYSDRCDGDYPDEPFECSTVDYAAPGEDVTSLHPTKGLATWWGTSMAAPHVTGVILLLQRANSDGRTATRDPDGRPDPIIFYE